MTHLAVLLSAALITEEWDPKRDPHEPVLSQGRQLFHTSGIFTFDLRFVLRNNCTCISSGTQVNLKL